MTSKSGSTMINEQSMSPVPEMHLSASSLRLENVTKQFGKMPAVDDITFEIPEGTFATLLGPSGCGKTTLLRLIAGFYDMDGGQIYLDHKRIDETPVHQR